MKIILSLILTLASISAVAAPRLVQVDFSSLGAGIDYKNYKQVTKIVEIEQRYGNVADVETNQWGLEGETAICLATSSLSDLQRIKDLLDVVAGKLTAVTFAHQCKTPRTEVLACSKDINVWGNASYCDCPVAGTTYNPQTGDCRPSYLSGRLERDYAIGGESADFRLVSYDGRTVTYLDVPKILKEKAEIFADRGLPTGVEGTYKAVKTQEKGWWIVFEVSELFFED